MCIVAYLSAQFIKVPGVRFSIELARTPVEVVLGEDATGGVGAESAELRYGVRAQIGGHRKQVSSQLVRLALRKARVAADAIGRCLGLASTRLSSRV